MHTNKQKLKQKPKTKNSERDANGGYSRHVTDVQFLQHLQLLQMVTVVVASHLAHLRAQRS
jgi:hypothetical protein